MNKHLLISILLVVSLFTLSASPAAAQGAATHYVNEGQSIQDAIDNAAPGDTIVIGAGEYFVGELYMYKSLTLQGSGTENTILYGSIHLYPPPPILRRAGAAASVPHHLRHDHR